MFVFAVGMRFKDTRAMMGWGFTAQGWGDSLSTSISSMGLQREAGVW